MTQAQKINGEWVVLEARTDGWYDGTTKVCDIYCEDKHQEYKRIEIVTI